MFHGQESINGAVPGAGEQEAGLFMGRRTGNRVVHGQESRKQGCSETVLL